MNIWGFNLSSFLLRATFSFHKYIEPENRNQDQVIIGVFGKMCDVYFRNDAYKFNTAL